MKDVEYNIVADDNLKMSDVAVPQESEPQKNAIDVLKEQHRKVENLFRQFQSAESRQKKTLFEQIAMELKIHAQIEEELVYPALQKTDEKVGDEAYSEHELIKFMIKDIEKTNPRGAELEAKVKVLKELVLHHVKEEETEALPELKESGSLDLMEVGSKLLERTEQLKKRMTAAASRKGRTGSRASTRKSASTKKKSARKTSGRAKQSASKTSSSRKGSAKTKSAKKSSTRRSSASKSRGTRGKTRKSTRSKS